MVIVYALSLTKMSIILAVVKYLVLVTVVAGLGFWFECALASILFGEPIYADPSGPLFVMLLLFFGWPVLWGSSLVPVMLQAEQPGISSRGWFKHSVVWSILVVVILSFLGLSPKYVDPEEASPVLFAVRALVVFLSVLLAWQAVAWRQNKSIDFRR
jgi:hypothetical protein